MPSIQGYVKLFPLGFNIFSSKLVENGAHKTHTLKLGRSSEDMEYSKIFASLNILFSLIYCNFF